MVLLKNWFTKTLAKKKRKSKKKEEVQLRDILKGIFGNWHEIETMHAKLKAFYS